MLVPTPPNQAQNKNTEMPYIAVLGVCAPQIRTGSRTEVGVIAFGFVDPLPAQILLEVDVERA